MECLDAQLATSKGPCAERGQGDCQAVGLLPTGAGLPPPLTGWAGLYRTKPQVTSAPEAGHAGPSARLPEVTAPRPRGGPWVTWHSHGSLTSWRSLWRPPAQLRTLPAAAATHQEPGSTSVPNATAATNPGIPELSVTRKAHRGNTTRAFRRLWSIPSLGSPPEGMSPAPMPRHSLCSGTCVLPTPSAVRSLSSGGAPGNVPETQVLGPAQTPGTRS